MKGISPIVSVILLLLITVSLVGIASTTIFDIFGTTSTETKETAIQVTENLQKNASIVSITSSNTPATEPKITVRNTGSKALLQDDVTVTIGDIEYFCDPIALNRTANCDRKDGVTTAFTKANTCNEADNNNKVILSTPAVTAQEFTCADFK